MLVSVGAGVGAAGPTVKVCGAGPRAVVTVTVWAPGVAVVSITMLAVSVVAAAHNHVGGRHAATADRDRRRAATKFVPVSVTATVVPARLDWRDARQGRRTRRRRLRFQG